MSSGELKSILNQIELTSFKLSQNVHGKLVSDKQFESLKRIAETLEALETKEFSDPLQDEYDEESQLEQLIKNAEHLRTLKVQRNALLSRMKVATKAEKPNLNIALQNTISQIAKLERI